MKKIEIKFNWLDALIVALIFPLAAGIILILINVWVKEPEVKSEPPVTFNPPIVVPSDFIAQLKSLQNPDALFAVAMWINSPNKTQFTTEDTVKLYYQISDLPPNKTAYFTLFNVSPTGELSQLLLNKSIQGDNIYSIPEPHTILEPDVPLDIVPQLTLEKGREYFKAIVTLDKIKAEKIMSMSKTALQQTIWGTESLTVLVDNP